MSVELFEACWAERKSAMRVAYRHLGNLADAEDCCQQIMLEMLRSDSEPRQSVHGLVCAVARRRAWTFMRDADRRRKYERQCPAPNVAIPRVLEHTVRAQLAKVFIYDQLPRLAPCERRTLLRVLAGETLPDRTQSQKRMAVRKLRYYAGISPKPKQ